MNIICLTTIQNGEIICLLTHSSFVMVSILREREREREKEREREREREREKSNQAKAQSR